MPYSQEIADAFVEACRTSYDINYYLGLIEENEDITEYSKALSDGFLHLINNGDWEQLTVLLDSVSETPQMLKNWQVDDGWTSYILNLIPYYSANTAFLYTLLQIPQVTKALQQDENEAVQKALENIAVSIKNDEVFKEFVVDLKLNLPVHREKRITLLEAFVNAQNEAENILKIETEQEEIDQEALDENLNKMDNISDLLVDYHEPLTEEEKEQLVKALHFLQDDIATGPNSAQIDEIKGKTLECIMKLPLMRNYLLSDEGKNSWIESVMARGILSEIFLNTIGTKNDPEKLLLNQSIEKMLREKWIPEKNQEMIDYVLILAAESYQKEVLENCLNIVGPGHAMVLNPEKMSLLQCAIDLGDQEAVDILLKRDEIKKTILSHKDIYGRTALDIAIIENNSEITDMLLGELGLEKSSFKDNAPRFNILNQVVIGSKLSQYLQLNGIDPGEVINEGGNCKGLVFLYQICTASGRENEFYDMLNFISEWDGKSLETLKNLQLPPSLTQKYKPLEREDENGNKQVISPNEVFFEQFTNDLAMFFHGTAATEELGLEWEQNDRIQQYGLMRNTSDGDQMRALFTQSGRLDKNQLTEMLEYFKQWPDSCIDISTPNHALALYITKEGQFKYYDPNFRNKATFNSAQDLAEHIIDYAYKENNQYHKNGTFDIGFDIFKFYKLKAEDIPKVEKPTPIDHNLSKSANGFTALHYAVMENNLERVEQLIRQNPEMMFIKDAHNHDALQMAINYGNQPIIKQFLKNEKMLEIIKTHDWQKQLVDSLAEFNRDNNTPNIAKSREVLKKAIENKTRHQSKTTDTLDRHKDKRVAAFVSLKDQYRSSQVDASTPKTVSQNTHETSEDKHTKRDSSRKYPKT